MIWEGVLGYEKKLLAGWHPACSRARCPAPPSQPPKFQGEPPSTPPPRSFMQGLNVDGGDLEGDGVALHGGEELAGLECAVARLLQGVDGGGTGDPGGKEGGVSKS